MTKSKKTQIALRLPQSLLDEFDALLPKSTDWCLVNWPGKSFRRSDLMRIALNLGIEELRNNLRESEADEDIKAGRVYGPFRTHEELVEFLKKGDLQ